MFGNNNIRCVGDGKEGEGPRCLFFEGGYISATGAIEINRDTIEFSRKKKNFRVHKTISKVKMFE